MNKAMTCVVAVILVAFGMFAAHSITQTQKNANNFNGYDLSKIIPANKDSGNIGDHVRGNKDAKIVFVEYADFQCPYCAVVHPRIEKVLAEYGDKIAVVFRNVVLPGHVNASAATAAAEAAGLQGYWDKYTSKLFATQREWGETKPKDREKVFTEMFMSISENKGDVDKFKKDFYSDEVKAKIKFDEKVHEKINLEGTPSLYFKGKLVNFDGAKTEKEYIEVLKKIIEKELSAAETK